MLFIILVFILLIISVMLIFIEESKEGVIAAMIFCGINWVLCLITYLSFFGIGLPGYNSDGTAVVTLYADMYGFFMLFYGLQWINTLLIFFCWYKWTQYAYGIKDTPENETFA